jgi:hypothetical protein
VTQLSPYQFGRSQTGLALPRDHARQGETCGPGVCEQKGRWQAGPRLQCGLVPPIALQNEIWFCQQTAVREGAAPLQTEPARTAIFEAASPCDAPRQRLSVVTPAHRSGKTWSASLILAATAGKSFDRTGEAA